MDAASRIKAIAREVGFDLCGIASADPIPEAVEHFRRWIDRGFHADLGWLRKEPERREDPRVMMPGAKSVILVAMNVFSPDPPLPPGHGRIAKYARGRDYHNVLTYRLTKLTNRIRREVDPAFRARRSVDAAPLFERAYAEKAGLGFIGRNANLITREFGSFVALGGLVTTMALPADAPGVRQCGACRRCIDACPTQAITEAHWVDARRCIATHTVERAAPIAPEIALGDRIVGCDTCQDVCPYNRRARLAADARFHPERGAGASLDLEEASGMTKEAFRTRFLGTPVARVTWRGLSTHARQLLDRQTTASVPCAGSSDAAACSSASANSSTALSVSSGRAATTPPG